MQYLVFANEADAQVRNAELCVENGCLETYYYRVMVHPTTGEAALLVPEYHIFKLTEQEQSTVKESDYMIDNGYDLDIID